MVRHAPALPRNSLSSPSTKGGGGAGGTGADTTNLLTSLSRPAATTRTFVPCATGAMVMNAPVRYTVDVAPLTYTVDGPPGSTAPMTYVCCTAPRHCPSDGKATWMPPAACMPANAAKAANAALMRTD